MYVDDYRRLGVQTRKNIYRAYAGIFENLDINQEIRDSLTGILFENENSVFTLKIYRPANYQDERLLYEPIEINRIGTNRKTSIPVKVYGITSGLIFNVIDSQVYDVDVYDSEIYDSVTVFDSNF
jgi:hypothetical protein